MIAIVPAEAFGSGQMCGARWQIFARVTVARSPPILLLSTGPGDRCGWSLCDARQSRGAKDSFLRRSSCLRL